jgi:hypothetical protein
MGTRYLWAIALMLLLPVKTVCADVIWENAAMRFTLGDDATARSLIERATGRELCAPQAKLPAATVLVHGKEHRAVSATRAGEQLQLRFAGVETILTYDVSVEPAWVRFQLSKIEGTRPERVTLLQVPLAITENVGRRLNIAWDDRTAVCLMAANRQVDCGASVPKEWARLRATSQDTPGPRLEGASAALLVSPTTEIRPLLRRAAHAFGLLTNEAPDGTPSKESEGVRGAYWFFVLGQEDADRMIEYCRRSGIRQVLLSSGSWCASPGHYLFNQQRFPDAEAGLKRLVDKLHAAGIKVGMHTFVSKVSKRDPYVTPKPDRRFWVDRKSTLAAAITADQTEIRCATDLREWPGSPVARQKVWEGGVIKHQEVILGDEIIQYESIGPEGRWDTFLGCKRGAWGTKPAAHPAGAEALHYGVDGCINGYIIDQETDLIDEVAERLAGIFNRCGFDMVYFDGGEDVDRTRFNYYASNFQEQAVRRFKRRPVIHMGTVMTHLLWHSFSRSSTVDTYINTLHGAIVAGASVENWPTVRGHIDKSVRYMLSMRQDLMPGELGWFGIWPKGRDTDGLQFDEFEYLLCKSLAYDAPVSLQTSFAEMDAHPLTPGLLDLFRIYDGLRMRRAVDEATRKQLAEQGKDFALLLAPGKPPRFIPVQPLEKVGGGRDVRACVGEVDNQGVATMWHAFRDGELLLALPPREVRATDLEGKPVRLATEASKVVVPARPARTTLYFPGRTAAQVRDLLERATVRTRPPTRIFIEAEAYSRIEGAMAKGSTVGIREPEANGDVIVPTKAADRTQPQPWYCEYTVRIPHDGRWTLWAHVRYPTGSDDSFAVVLPGEEPTLSMSQVLGNCGKNDRRWHWTGRGGGSTTPPPGVPIAFNLKKGLFTFRIHAREGSALPEMAPRLDRLCLSDTDTPPDEEE